MKKEIQIKNWEEEFEKLLDNLYLPLGRTRKTILFFIRQLLEEEKKEWLGERKKEPFKVKEDKRFTYYQCCGQVVGIGKKIPDRVKIWEIKCGKCGRRIYQENY